MKVERDVNVPDKGGNKNYELNCSSQLFKSTVKNLLYLLVKMRPEAKRAWGSKKK